MHKQNVEPGLKSCVNQRQGWGACFGWLSAALVMSLSLGFVLVAHTVLAPLLPKLPNRPEGFTARVGWYLQEREIVSDVRTLAAAFRYLLEAESGRR